MERSECMQNFMEIKLNGSFKKNIEKGINFATTDTNYNKKDLKFYYAKPTFKRDNKSIYKLKSAGVETKKCNGLVNFISSRAGLNSFSGGNFKSRNLGDLIVKYWYDEATEMEQHESGTVMEKDCVREARNIFPYW
jgi:hypothetical protein